jgi:hypothetical protein
MWRKGFVTPIKYKEKKKELTDVCCIAEMML